MRKVPVGKSGRDFRYEILEDGKVIASRRSSREYAAALVGRNGDNFYAPYYFGRVDLIGKGDSRFLYESDKLYAIAYYQPEA